MMRRQIIVTAVTLLICSLGALAMEWKELDWGADAIVDSATGLPAVVFHAAVEYSEVPGSTRLSGNWQVVTYVNGVEVPVDIAPSTAVMRGAVYRIYTSTSHIVVEAGKRYVATVTLQDTDNDLSYRRTFDYTAPSSSPYGISLRGWDGSDEIDLREMPDEELEELVLLHDLVKGYRQSPVETTVTAFLRGDAAAKPDTAILVDGELGVGQEIDRCTYSACGVGCCSTCIEHSETAEDPSSQEAGSQAEGTDAPSPDVRIECIVYEGEEFEFEGDEYVQIKNFGDASQDLLGWTLANQKDPSHAFTFSSSFVLEPGQSIRVYTNEVHPESGGFSFESETAIWTNVTVYPVSLLLIPMPETIAASSSSAIRFSVVLTLYTYSLASPDEISAILTQLGQFDQEFTGRIYTGSGSSILGGGKTLFVQDIVMRILEAAAIELKNR
jgi:hypothetical protein